jgi:hypothetical protein
MQPELREAIRPFYKGVDGLNYSHLSLSDQLNLGLRNLEIDVYYDPAGGRYAHPLGEKLLKAANITPWPREDADDLNTPGFKAMHDADFDFRTCHIAFERSLKELREWSDSHPGHEPIVLTMNAEQEDRKVPGAAQPAPFDQNVLKLLSSTIESGLGRNHLLTPDDVRGRAHTLREAVQTHGWPPLSRCRGKFIFVLDEGGDTRARYLAAFPGLRGAALFPDADPGTDEAAIFIMNDPARDEAKIRSLVDQGFMVRTRADSDTKEARASDHTRFEAALRSGAQIITTDYYIPDRSVSDRYFIRFEDGSFWRIKPL